jgi:hypothetical protein
MRLYIPTMDATLVEFDDAGRVRFDGEDWAIPKLQERRAILHAAHEALQELQALIAVFDPPPPR